MSDAEEPRRPDAAEGAPDGDELVAEVQEYLQKNYPVGGESKSPRPSPLVGASAAPPRRGRVAPVLIAVTIVIAGVAGWLFFRGAGPAPEAPASQAASPQPPGVMEPPADGAAGGQGEAVDPGTAASEPPVDPVGEVDREGTADDSRSDPTDAPGHVEPREARVEPPDPPEAPRQAALGGVDREPAEDPTPDASPEPSAPDSPTGGSVTVANQEDFVTCLGVERVDGRAVRPQGVTTEFAPGLVHVFARVRSPGTETLELQWIDTDGSVLRSHRVTVRRNLAPGFRIYFNKGFQRPGDYEVRLLDSGGRVVASRGFSIRR